MHLTLEQFKELSNQKQNKTTENKSFSNVSFFNIPDGGEAVVRFAYTDPSQFDIVTFHQVAEPGKPTWQGKRYNCVRDFRDPIDTCPLCAAGIPLSQKFIIKLVEYTRDENGKIVASPKIWERSTAWVNKLQALCEEYGNISDMVFKIKRTGTGTDTKYTDPMLANPSIYNSELYVKDFSGFDNYKVIGTLIADKPVNELKELVPGTDTAARKVVY